MLEFDRRKIEINSNKRSLFTWKAYYTSFLKVYVSQCKHSIPKKIKKMGIRFMHCHIIALIYAVGPLYAFAIRK